MTITKKIDLDTFASGRLPGIQQPGDARPGLPGAIPDKGDAKPSTAPGQEAFAFLRPASTPRPSPSGGLSTGNNRRVALPPFGSEGASPFAGLGGAKRPQSMVGTPSAGPIDLSASVAKRRLSLSDASSVVPSGIGKEVDANILSTIGTLNASPANDSQRLATLQSCRAKYEALPPEQRSGEALGAMADLMGRMTRPDAQDKKGLGAEDRGAVKEEFGALIRLYQQAQATNPQSLKPSSSLKKSPDPYVSLVSTLNTQHLDDLLPGIVDVKNTLDKAQEPSRMAGRASLSAFVNNGGRVQSLDKWVTELADSHKNGAVSNEDAFKALTSVENSMTKTIPHPSLHEDALALSRKIISLKEGLEPGCTERMSIQANQERQSGRTVSMAGIAAQQSLMARRGPGSAFAAAQSAMEKGQRLGPVSDKFGLARKDLQAAVWKEKYPGEPDMASLPQESNDEMNRSIVTSQPLAAASTPDPKFTQTGNLNRLVEKYNLHPVDDAEVIKTAKQLIAQNTSTWNSLMSPFKAG